MTAIPRISALFETSLASSMTASASSFTVVSGTDRDGNALSGTYGFVVDEGTADEEFFVGSISGTTVTVTYRGCDAETPTTEVTANKKAHRRGASVKITDYPILGYIRELLNGTFTFPNKLAYESAPTFIYGNKELVTYDKMKDYADGLANTGAADATTTVQGLVEEATQAEVDARTTTGATGAKLFAPLDKIRASLYHDYAADAGANDTYAVTITPAATAYTTGMVVEFKANTANTGACTLNVNSLGAKSLKVNKDLDPQDGYIKAGAIVLAVYDGTNFQIQSVSGKPSVSQSGEEIYGASSSGNDTYAITVAPAPSAYVTGQRFFFKPDTANTGATTLNVNSLGAKTIKKFANGSAVDLSTGDISANQPVTVIYDGTDMIMISASQPRPLYATGVSTRSPGSGTGDQTIAHGLDAVPRLLKVTVISGNVGVAGQNPQAGTCYGSATSTSAEQSLFFGRSSGSTTSSTNIIDMQSTDGTSRIVGGLTTLDSTNIVINFSTFSTETTHTIILWETYA